MASPNWFRWIVKKSFPARFIMAKASRLPVLGPVIEHALFGGDDIVYLPLERAVKKQVAINRDVERPADLAAPSKVVEHFVSLATHRFIMNACICREASDCKDYPQGLGCLFLGEAVLSINPGFGRLASEDEALEHLRKCREAGLVHLIGRNKLDTVWLNVRPKEKLLTICHCCPCCCLWRVLPDIRQSISERVNRLPGVKVEVTEKCVGCGKCTRDVCFVQAIALRDGRAVIDESCRGCGRCADACPAGAIQITLPTAQDLENTVQRMAELVDLK